MPRSGRSSRSSTTAWPARTSSRRPRTPDDPQTRRVYQSAVYLLNILDQVPVHVIPCVEGRIESAEQLRRRQLLRLDPPRGVELHARARSRGLGSVWTTLHLAKEAETAELLGIPDGMTQVALIPVAYYTGDDFKPAVRPPVEGITYWDTWGATARVTRGASARVRTADALCRVAPRDRRGRAPGPSPSSAPPPATPAPPTGSSGPGSTTTPGGSPPRSQARGVGPGVHVGILGPTSRALVTTIQATSTSPAGRWSRSRSRCASARSRSSSSRPAGASPTPTPRSWSSTPTSRRSSTRRPTARRGGAARRARARGRPRRRRARGHGPPDDPERLAILQFTSGSTAAPKGVMLPDRCVGANIDAIIAGAQHHPRRPRGVVAAAVPRHGAHRAADDADAPRLRARARRAAGLPRPPRVLVGVDLGVPRHHHRRAQLLVRARGARAAPRRCARPVELAARAQRRGDRRPERGRGVLRRGGAVRLRRPRRVPGVRHGRGHARRDLPRGRRGHDRRRGRSPRARARPAWRRAGRRRRRPSRCAAWRCSADRSHGFELRIVDPAHRRGARATARSASSSCAARR